MAKFQDKLTKKIREVQPGHTFMFELLSRNPRFELLSEKPLKKEQVEEPKVDKFKPIETEVEVEEVKEVNKKEEATEEVTEVEETKKVEKTTKKNK